MRLLKQLLQSGADINARGGDSIPPIVSIIERDSLDLIDYCLEQGAVLKPLEVQEQAFAAAINTGKLPLLEKVVDNGASITSEGLKANDLILKAYQKGGVKLLSALLDQIDEANAISPKSKATLWKEVARKNDLEVLELLLKHNAGPVDEDGNNLCIEAAIDHKQLKILKALEKHDIPIVLQSSQGECLSGRTEETKATYL